MIGQNLGSFKIESVLGSGAMGVVYKATQETTGKPAAIKVILGDPTLKGNASERFKREAEILQQFRHPNIVRFLAVGRSAGKSYFAMEFVSGTTLDATMQERGPLAWREVVDLAIQLCDGLHYAHEHGVVHRDLKPSNLLFSDKGRLKLTDFGIAKDLDATALTATGRTLGTAGYMAPEQIRGTPEISHKTDLYALGVLLYQMLTGVLPYEGSTAVVLMHQHMTAAIPRPSAKVRDIPKALDDLVVALMAKAPADRPWDAAAVGLNLQNLREKDHKKESIAMVWPADGDPAGQPTRAAAGLEARTKTKAKSKKSAKKTRATSDVEEDSGHDRVRHILGTAGLVAGLLALGGVFAYAFWPPGEAYLHRHAAALMASPSYSDWATARDEYIEPLRRKYPDKHREEVEGWLDKIALNAAERRAGRLEASRENGLGGPSTDVETLYMKAFSEAQAALKVGEDSAAIRAWQALPDALKPFGEEARGWSLLAGQRARTLDLAMAARRTEVEGLLAESQRSEILGNHARARSLRQEVATKYARYVDLAPIVEMARSWLAKPADEPTPAPEAKP